MTKQNYDGVYPNNKPEDKITYTKEQQLARIKERYKSAIDFKTGERFFMVPESEMFRLG